MQSGKSWAEISAKNLQHNFRTLQAAAAAEDSASGIGLLAVIKANAYGHGAALCAPLLAQAGAAWLGVTDASEGVCVRQSMHEAGVPLERQPEILIMCGMEQEDAPAIVQHALTPVVWFGDQLRWLTEHCSPAAPLRIHVEVDTGMARQGVEAGAALEELLSLLNSLPQLELAGVMTHFASAEVSGSPLTRLQQSRFVAALAQVRHAGFAPLWIHAGNSSTLDEAESLPWLRRSAAASGARALLRSGLALYGHTLPIEGGVGTLAARLRPVLTWKTRILALRDLPAGATVGYNATFTASRPMRTALLPVGYADGLRRELSGPNDRRGGWVVIQGRHAPILGRISMNLTVVDITDVPSAAVGQEVTLLGPGISAMDHAHLARTIPYEILCGVRTHRRLVP